MTHEQLYEVFNAINLAAMLYLLGRQSGFSAGAYEGAKQAAKLLDERGLIVDTDDEDDES